MGMRGLAAGDAGRLNKTTAGIVNCRSESFAVQEKKAPTVSLPSVAVPITSEKPVITTSLLGSPPVQVICWPLARVMVEMLPLLVQTSEAGRVKFCEKAPTSTPPGPEIV